MVRKIMAFSNQGIVNRSQHILSHQKVRTRKPRRTSSDLYSVPSQKRSIGSNNIVSAGFTEKLSKVWVSQNDLFLEDEHLEVTGWRESWSPGWSGKGTIWNSREGLSCQLIPTLYWLKKMRHARIWDCVSMTSNAQSSAAFVCVCVCACELLVLGIYPQRCLVRCLQCLLCFFENASPPPLIDDRTSGRAEAMKRHPPSDAVPSLRCIQRGRKTWWHWIHAQRQNT